MNTRRLTFFAVGVGVILAVAIVLYLGPFTGSEREFAEEVKIAGDFELKIEGSPLPVRVERAFRAGSHGGWHGDGSSMIVYQASHDEAVDLAAALKRAAPSLIWREELVCGSAVERLGRLIPEVFQPAQNGSLVHGRPSAGDPYTEYYADIPAAKIYVVYNTF
jgi:hypothetical protein